MMRTDKNSNNPLKRNDYETYIFSNSSHTDDGIVSKCKPDNTYQLENQPSDAVQQARQEAALPSMQQEEQEGQEARQGLQVLQEGQPVQGWQERQAKLRQRQAKVQQQQSWGNPYAPGDEKRRNEGSEISRCWNPPNKVFIYFFAIYKIYSYLCWKIESSIRIFTEQALKQYIKDHPKSKVAL